MKKSIITLIISLFLASLASAQGTKQCFGDGVGNICPCLNNNNSSGSRGNAAGCANSATLAGCNLDAAGGSNSVAADDLVLCFDDAPPNVPGILYCGTIRLAAPFGDGIRCCGGNVRRIDLIFSDASGAGCSTVGIASTSGQGAGDTGCYQYWYRDPAGPCFQSFNLSNAYKVLWTP
ncbi:MAG: hypothetical protein ACI8X5_002413 [Planctomycetota bacterium]|jgi:hypothetical protein